MATRVNYQDLESIDLHERSQFLTRLFSLRTALMAIKTCEEKGLNKEKVPNNILKIIQSGLKDGLIIINGLLEDIKQFQKTEQISPYKFIVLSNIFRILDNYWLDDLHTVIINEKKMTEGDRSRVRGALRELNRIRDSLLHLQDLKRQPNDPDLVTFIKEIEDIQGQLFLDITEEVSAIEQYSERVHDDLQPPSTP
jgi:hypothetical protein